MLPFNKGFATAQPARVHEGVVPFKSNMDFNPMSLLKMLDEVKEQYLCPNRIWHVLSQVQDGPSRQSILQEIHTGMFPNDALRHEDHSACSIDYCEFSSRNFTAVQQYHEPSTCEGTDKANKNHKHKGICSPIRNLFNDTMLVRAVQSDKTTAWRFDGLGTLEHPRPFMAISHVWSDGTGAGTWSSKQVNECVYRYFKRLAKRFQCEGIWWDSLCVPRDARARSKALSIMHRNYEDARVTVVHDRFLRKVPFEGPDRACFAIILSSWFTRGWTALELAKSRKVKIIFKDSIRDLDKHILDQAQEENIAARSIKDLRKGRFSNIEDLLTTLGPRYTSWLKDRAVIAGLLAGVEFQHMDTDTFTRDIYQTILKKIGEISYDHLFHNSVTMSKGFSWCATNLFRLPHATGRQRLKISNSGELSGPWKILPVSQLNPKTCIWGKSHELIEASLQYALENEKRQHLLLVKPTEEGHGIEETEKGILVKVRRNPRREDPQFRCHFVGSLYFFSTMENSKFPTRDVIIGNTKGWEELNRHEDAWQIMKKETDSRAESRIQSIEGMPLIVVGTKLHWTDLHRAAWLGDARIGDVIKASFAKIEEADRRILLQRRDEVGRRAIHLAAERGNKVFIEILLDNKDDPNSRIHSEFDDANYRKPENGQTPLHRAAWGGSLETVELLFNRGSDIGATDKRGNTALHIAADMGFGDVVTHLCRYLYGRASVKVPGWNGLTPLHYATLGGQYQAAKVLIAQKAPIDAKDSKFGWTPLHCAAEGGQVSVIRLLLERGAKVNETDDKVGWTPLHFAAMSGNTATVETLIVGGADVGREDKNGFTPLLFAAIKGHHTVVEALLRRGATGSNAMFDRISNHVRGFGAEGQQLRMNSKRLLAKLSSVTWGGVYLAAMDAYTKPIRLLVDNDTHVSKEKIGSIAEALLCAAKHGLLGTVRLLQQIAADRDIENSSDSTIWSPYHANDQRATHALLELNFSTTSKLKMIEEISELAQIWSAARAGEYDVTRVLFVESNNEAKDQLLIKAVWEGHEVAVRALLQAGSDMEVKITDAVKHYNETPLLCVAVEKGDENKVIVETLLEAGADVNGSDKTGRTPLAEAFANRHKSKRIIQTLLQAGADTETRSTVSRLTPLMMAAADGDESKDLIQLLLKAGANANASEPNTSTWLSGSGGRTPLLLAIRAGGGDVMRLLIKAGANVNAADNGKTTPLEQAVKRGQEEVVRVLLDAGADKEAINWDGDTPLFVAIKAGGKDVIRLLLKAGANVNAKNKSNGNTPLMEAVSRGQEDVARLLLKAGANVHAAADYGNTALMEAAQHGNEEVIRMLLGAGADVNAADKDGLTPLLAAARNGKREAVQILLDAGANRKAVDRYGNTLLSLAQKRGWKGIA